MVSRTINLTYKTAEFNSLTEYAKCRLIKGQTTLFGIKTDIENYNVIKTKITKKRQSNIKPTKSKTMKVLYVQ